MILSVLQTDFFENIVEAQKTGMIGNQKVELVKYDNNYDREFKRILSIATLPNTKKQIANDMFGRYSFVLDKISLKNGAISFIFFDLKGRIDKKLELIKTIN